MWIHRFLTKMGLAKTKQLIIQQQESIECWVASKSQQKECSQIDHNAHIQLLPTTNIVVTHHWKQND
jgi:hypothetical protein